MTAGARPLRLPAPPGFDFAWIAAFLAARAVPALEHVTGDEVRRIVRLPDGRPVTLAVRHVPGPDGRAELVATSAPTLPRAELRRLVADLFDLDADLASFYALARGDAVLARLVAARPGIRLPRFLDLFEAVVRAIFGQQVSVAAARTMAGRLVGLLGEEVEGGPLGGSARAFPRPKAVAAAGPAALGSLGLTRAKAGALVAAAEAALDGRLDAARLRALPSEEAQSALDALPGVGPWTACYVRMRGLGDRDAFPAADLGVLKALAARLGRRPTPREVESVARAWRPWRAYATLHLWESLSAP